jgi:hypothetical protein
MIFSEAKIETFEIPWGWVLAVFVGTALSLLWWWFFRRPLR